MNEPTAFAPGPREQWAPIAKIDVVPLLGVLMALLMATLVGLPRQEGVITVSLPSQLCGPRDIPSIVVLELDFDGTLQWDGQALRHRRDFAAHLDAVAAQANQAEFRVRVNPLAPYKAVTAVISAAQDHGLKKIALVSQSEPFHFH